MVLGLGLLKRVEVTDFHVEEMCVCQPTLVFNKMTKKREGSPQPEDAKPSPKKSTATKSKPRAKPKNAELEAKIDRLTEMVMSLQEENAVLRAELGEHDKRIRKLEPTTITLDL